MKLKNGQVIIYEIKKEYLDYLRKFDHRVSIKQHRRFVGVVVSRNDVDYCIPLSTKVFTSNGKARSPKITSVIKKSNNPIAVLLYNNMIPVVLSELNVVDVTNDPDKDYLNNEIRFLQRNIKEVERKANYVYRNFNKNKFMKEVCLNIRKLEYKREAWIKEKLMINEVNREMKENTEKRVMIDFDYYMIKNVDKEYQIDNWTKDISIEKLYSESDGKIVWEGLYDICYDGTTDLYCNIYFDENEKMHIDFLEGESIAGTASPYPLFWNDDYDRKRIEYVLDTVKADMEFNSFCRKQPRIPYENRNVGNSMKHSPSPVISDDKIEKLDEPEMELEL